MNRAYPLNLLQGPRGAPPLPRVGGNQSCLTADIWFHSECSNMIRQIKKVNQGDTPESGATRWHKKVARVYTRHIEKF